MTTYKTFPASWKIHGSIFMRFEKKSLQSITRRECLKTKGLKAQNQRLKKRKVFKVCIARIHEKLRKQFRDPQMAPLMLDETRKPLFPNLKKNSDFLSQNVA